MRTQPALHVPPRPPRQARGLLRAAAGVRACAASRAQRRRGGTSTQQRFAAAGRLRSASPPPHQPRHAFRMRGTASAAPENMKAQCLHTSLRVACSCRPAASPTRRVARSCVHDRLGGARSARPCRPSLAPGAARAKASSNETDARRAFSAYSLFGLLFYDNYLINARVLCYCCRS